MNGVGQNRETYEEPEEGCLEEEFHLAMVKLHKDGEGNREALGMSSNINEVIKTVLNFSLFFYEKVLHAPKSTKKHQKHKKHKNATKQKHKNANKQTKIKNALKKYLRGKKSLIRLFAFLCLRRKK